MPPPADHAALLRRDGFPLPDDGLDEPHRALLARYGYWLEALATGTIQPETPEQRRFVQCARGEAEPASAFESAWASYRRATPPTADPLELARRFDRLQAARAAASAAQSELDARRDDILAQVRPLLDALDAEFADRLAALRDDSARLEAEAREAAMAFGASFKHAGVHAVYARGRVSWDNDGLARYTESHPEVAEFRRVGKPTVSLRFQGRPDDAAGTTH